MRYRVIYSKIWNDAEFNKLSDRAKLVFLFLLTHPDLTSVGAMRATIPGLAAELGWSEKAFREAFREAFGKAFRKGFMKASPEHLESITESKFLIDEKAHFLWVKNFLKYNKPGNPNVLKAWFSSLDLLPECDMKILLIQALKAFAKGLPKAFQEAFNEAFSKAFPEGFPKGYRNQEQYSGTVSNKKEKKKFKKRKKENEEQNPDSSLTEPDGSGARSADAEPSCKKASKNPPCPYEKILELYRRYCGDLPQPRELTPVLKKNILARWKEHPDLAWWEEYFRQVNKSDFLMGRQTHWKATFAWLLGPRNMTKVLCGNYDHAFSGDSSKPRDFPPGSPGYELKDTFRALEWHWGREHERQFTADGNWKPGGKDWFRQKYPSIDL